MHITAALFTGVKSERARERAIAANEALMDNAALVKNMHADPRKLQWKAVRG